MRERTWFFCSLMTSLVVRHFHQFPSDVSLRSIRKLRADLDKAASGLAWKRAYVFELFSPSPISDPSSRVCSFTPGIRRRITQTIKPDKSAWPRGRTSCGVHRSRVPSSDAYGMLKGLGHTWESSSFLLTEARCYYRGRSCQSQVSRRISRGIRGIEHEE